MATHSKRKEMKEIPQFSFADLERNAHQTNVSEFTAQLAELLSGLENETNELSRWCTECDSNEQVLRTFTHLASLIRQVFGMAKLSKENYNKLRPYTPTIAHVFRLSGFQNADTLLEPLVANAGRDAAGRLKFASSSDARKFLLFCSLFSRHVKYMIDLLSLDLQAVYPEFLRLSRTGVSIDQIAHQNRLRILASGQYIFPLLPKGSESLISLHHLWALSSYAPTTNRHDIKVFINQIFYRWLSSKGATSKDTLPKPREGAKPRLLVASEAYGKGHVMARCFDHWFEQLKSRFCVILLIEQGDLADESIEWADEVVTFPWEPGEIRHLVGRVADLSPHAIFYPSLGMRLWTILLCNLRLAHFQCAGLGHPATTHSPEIDCFIAGSEMVGDPACFSESVVYTKAPGNFMIPDLGRKQVSPNIRESPELIRIAVCANLLKLNPDFITALRSIAEKTNRRIQYHLFPNASGLRYQVARTQLNAALSGIDIRVYTRTATDKYIENLNTCDLYFSPFPFGGENSALDAILQGLPCVTLESMEPSSRLDARLLEMLGFQEELIAATFDKYISIACNLINSDESRTRISKALLQCEPRELIEQSRKQHQSDLAETIAGELEKTSKAPQSGRIPAFRSNASAYDPARMRIAMTMMVRDEADIIRDQIQYHLSNGVDIILACDHLSNDGTTEILEEFAKDGRLRLFHHREETRSQWRWITKLARLAATEHQAHWVINADADEFFLWRDGTLKEAFSALSRKSMAFEVQRHDFVPIERPEKQSPIVEMVYRKTNSTESDGSPLLPKVFHRATNDIVVLEGNHGAWSGMFRGTEIGKSNLEIFHYPIRSYAHFLRKVRSGNFAYEGDGELSEMAGRHWRQWNHHLESGELEAEFRRNFFDDFNLKGALDRGEVVGENLLRDKASTIRGAG